MKTSDSGERRRFLTRALLAGVGLFSYKVVGASPLPTSLPAQEEESVRLLSPDGKLVEVKLSVLQAQPKRKVSNQEILDWRKSDAEM